ncbi:helicase-associated domain-containing protein [Microbacterium sp. YY-01]|uniref:helicase-associated domain-containing protein n=1 Tax=Microbacterium sp. YY-01 TaxID=3421634 RepID=UPI003D180A46
MSIFARPLAEELASLSDTQLAALLQRRRVASDAPWNDFFDAAEHLLDPASVEDALGRLPLPLALAVWHPESIDTDVERSLQLHALASPHSRVWPSVRDAARVLPDPRHVAVTPDPLALMAHDEADPADTARAAERASATVAAIAELVLFVSTTPLVLRANGILRTAERRRIEESNVLLGAITTDDALALARAARLVVVSDKQWQATPAGLEWVGFSRAQRWSTMVEAFRAALPHDVRTPTGGWIPLEHWHQWYPWNTAWPHEYEALLRQAWLLGLLTDSGLPPWTQAIAEGHAASTEQLSPLLPAEVDRLFLQNDLTAIAPGPLAPALDVRLRRMAHREAASHASSYRFTADSMAQAFAEGETEADIIAFLHSISLTGVPQPLEYLVTQQAHRHGLVRVRTDRTTGTTHIESPDAAMLATIAVDHSLRPLALVREGTSLTTRVGTETVLWALVDARYPASAIDAAGHDIRFSRTITAADVPAQHPEYSSLIARLRERVGPDADAAWLERELEAAVRGHQQVELEIAMPDGSLRTLTVEAAGVGGGRFRGRDRAADVERSLPLRSIRTARIIS